LSPPAQVLWTISRSSAPKKEKKGRTSKEGEKNCFLNLKMKTRSRRASEKKGKRRKKTGTLNKGKAETPNDHRVRGYVEELNPNCFRRTRCEESGESSYFSLKPSRNRSKGLPSVLRCREEGEPAEEGSSSVQKPLPRSRGKEHGRRRVQVGSPHLTRRVEGHSMRGEGSYILPDKKKETTFPQKKRLPPSLQIRGADKLQI